MKNKEFKSLIKNEFSRIETPNRKEELLEDIRYVSQNTVESQPRKNRSLKMMMMTLCSAFVLMFAFISFQPRDDEYLISLDVNPSIELQIDKNEKVSHIDCHNEDGEIVLDDMDLVGTDVDVAVNAIIGSMYKNGYLSKVKNSVLVSVQGKDESIRTAMKQRVVDDIKKTLSAYELESSVISQDYAQEKEAKKKADQYGISVGKAMLIHEFVSMNNQYRFEELVKLSIDELNTLVHYNNIHFTTISIDGIESREGYLTEEELKALVLKHARVLENEIQDYQYDLVCENNRLIYKVEFSDVYGRYLYGINAISGSIVSFEIEV